MCMFCRANNAHEWVKGLGMEAVLIRDEVGFVIDSGHQVASLLYLVKADPELVGKPSYGLFAETFSDQDKDTHNMVALDQQNAIRIIEELSRMLADDGAAQTSHKFPTYDSLVEWGQRAHNHWLNDDNELFNDMEEFWDEFMYESNDPDDRPDADFASGIYDDFSMADLNSIVPQLSIGSEAPYAPFLEFGRRPESNDDSQDSEIDGNEGDAFLIMEVIEIEAIAWELEIDRNEGE